MNTTASRRALQSTLDWQSRGLAPTQLLLLVLLLLKLLLKECHLCMQASVLIATLAPLLLELCQVTIQLALL